MPLTPGARMPARAEDDVAGVGLVVGLELVLQLPSDHRVHDARRGGVVDVDRPDVLAVAQDRHRVADGKDLGDAVRDVDDRQPVLGEPGEHVQQVVGLGRGQRRGGLVQDQHPWLTRDGAGDLDELAQRDRQPRDGFVEVHADADLVQGVLGDLLELAPPDEPGARRHRPEQDVLGNRHLRDQAELLVDQRDAGLDGVLRAARLEAFAVDDDVAAVGDQDPREHAHERGLAGPVLADDGVDLPRRDGQADVVDSDDAAKVLVEVVCLEDGRAPLRAGALVPSVSHASTFGVVRGLRISCNRLLLLHTRAGPDGCQGLGRDCSQNATGLDREWTSGAPEAVCCRAWVVTHAVASSLVRAPSRRPRPVVRGVGEVRARPTVAFTCNRLLVLHARGRPDECQGVGRACRKMRPGAWARSGQSTPERTVVAVVGRTGPRMRSGNGRLAQWQLWTRPTMPRLSLQPTIAQTCSADVAGWTRGGVAWRRSRSTTSLRKRWRARLDGVACAGPGEDLPCQRRHTGARARQPPQRWAIAATPWRAGCVGAGPTRSGWLWPTSATPSSRPSFAASRTTSRVGA